MTHAERASAEDTSAASFPGVGPRTAILDELGAGWLDRFRDQARAALPPYAFGYFEAVAGDGENAAEARRDWDAVRFRPRILTDTSDVDTSTTVLGTPVASPVLIAPMAQQVIADPAGEAASAAAAARHDTVIGISTQTAIPFAEIARSGAPWWYQVYVMQHRWVTELLVQRAVQAGASALVLTVDVASLPPAAADFEPSRWPDVPGRHRVGNLSTVERAALPPGALIQARDVGPETVRWLAELSGLPVLVKGVLRGDDARVAIDAGAAGVIVSTHGARSLARSITSAAALLEVVDAVAGDGEVYVDSGLRRGDHIAAALCAGARGVFLGRPVLWGLAAGGVDGAASVLAALNAELSETMRQVGAASIGQLTRDLLVGGRLVGPS